MTLGHFMKKELLFFFCLVTLILSGYYYFNFDTTKHSKIDSMNKNIVIYSKSYCPYCIHAKKFFLRKGLPFEEIDILETPHRRDEMLEKSNGQRTVPQIFIGEKHIGGYTDLIKLEEDGLFESYIKD